MNPQTQQWVGMFVDITGSASLYQKLSNTEAAQSIADCLKSVSEEVDRHHGRTLEIAGDEVLVAFDTAPDAWRAAIEIQRRVGRLVPVSGHPMSIRIGLHCDLAKQRAKEISREFVDTLARIAGQAHPAEILISHSLLAALPDTSAGGTKPTLPPRFVSADSSVLQLFLVGWQDEQIVPLPLTMSPPPPTSREKLCVRYHGKAFLLDDKSPVLSLGRDLTNELVIEDRKASRHHARIEKRGAFYYLVDNSTNGSFVSVSEGQEVMVRRHEIRLEGSGRICFGSSINDPSVDCAEFEPL